MILYGIAYYIFFIVLQYIIHYLCMYYLFVIFGLKLHYIIRYDYIETYHVIYRSLYILNWDKSDGIALYIVDIWRSVVMYI